MDYSARDYQTIWHPYTDLHQFEGYPVIEEGKGAVLYDTHGNRYIDAVSSWWVNLHGHAHPYIAQQIYQQAQQLEHVIFSHFTHPSAIKLAQRLLHHLPDNQSKIFFSDNGSTAVEVGLKMALQYFYNQDKSQQSIIAFSKAYHGDTFGAMSVGERRAFTTPFKDYLFDVHRVDVPFPGQENRVVNQFERILQKNQDIAAFIFEPLVLGVAGMIMYSPEVLDKLLALCQQYNVISIADEVMTGFGRTGKFFATDYCDYNPDIICMSKGATGGTLAIGLTSCTQQIQDAFKSANPKKSFFHGHSFTANPLACTAGNASLDLLEKGTTQQKIQEIEVLHRTFYQQIKQHKKVRTIRMKGTIIAFEIKTKGPDSYFNNVGKIVQDYAQSHGVLLRPFGNLIYIIPPYCITKHELEQVYQVITESLSEV